MKLIKSIVAISLMATIGMAQAVVIVPVISSQIHHKKKKDEEQRKETQKKKEEENISSSTPKLGQACLVEISTSNHTSYYNVNVIRYVEIAVNRPNELKIDYLGNNRQDTTFSINYDSKEEAAKALTDLVKKINKCK
jgi:uncharacterized membrane protein YhiD involved in acid resistance